MTKIIELREKRANLWNATKAFLDSHRGEDGMVSAEDNAAYEKMEADVVALGKEIERLERQAAIDREMDQPTSTPLVSRPSAGVNQKQGRASDEYKTAFWGMMRSRSAGPSVMNALQIGTDSEGGFLVPDEYERTLVQGLEEENVLRSLCTVIQTSSGDRKIPIVASHGTASWVDEEGTIPESDDAFGQISIGAHKVATMIKVSDELLQDSVFNIENYIASEFARRIGAAEENAFINGDGSGKPTGLLHATNGAATGVTTAGNNVAADEIIDLVHSIKSVYRNKAVFLMNDSTIKAIRKLKSIEGQYLWQPGLKEGQPDTLLNYRIVTSPYMPEVAAGNKVILFGDFKSYWIADRQGRSFQRLNELFAVTGQVGFRATQRVDGRLVLAEAMKCLAIKA
ncbi:MAG: phage major capsid protein [Oscillospiraceae bacterium]|nr:phage major capsid protein [Oscillospiraceae bacterium]